MDGGTVAGIVVGLLCLACTLLPVVLIPLYATVIGFRRREQAQQVLATQEPRLAHLLRTSTEAPGHRGPTTLVHGSAAYAADFPSRWATGWRTIMGGHAVSLTEQADMARRLASVRMLEQAARQGAMGVTNIRMEANQIDMSSNNTRGRGAMVFEMLAYGTALLPAPGGGRPPAADRTEPA